MTVHQGLHIVTIKGVGREFGKGRGEIQVPMELYHKIITLKWLLKSEKEGRKEGRSIPLPSRGPYQQGKLTSAAGGGVYLQDPPTRVCTSQLPHLQEKAGAKSAQVCTSQLEDKPTRHTPRMQAVILRHVPLPSSHVHELIGGPEHSQPLDVILQDRSRARVMLYLQDLQQEDSILKKYV